jgi:hypothetical protein
MDQTNLEGVLEALGFRWEPASEAHYLGGKNGAYIQFMNWMEDGMSCISITTDRGDISVNVKISEFKVDLWPAQKHAAQREYARCTVTES